MKRKMDQNLRRPSGKQRRRIPIAEACSLAKRTKEAPLLLWFGILFFIMDVKLVIEHLWVIARKGLTEIFGCQRSLSSNINHLAHERETMT